MGTSGSAEAILLFPTPFQEVFTLQEPRRMLNRHQRNKAFLLADRFQYQGGQGINTKRQTKNQSIVADQRHCSGLKSVKLTKISVSQWEGALGKELIMSRRAT